MVRLFVFATEWEAESSPGVYLREDPLLGTQLQNQSELRAPTLEKAAFYLDAALAARTPQGAPEASYSHLLYTLHVYQYSVDRSGRGGVAGGRSRLHLLDLASCQRSQRAPVTPPSPGNGPGNGPSNGALTLSALGNVLVALFNGQRHLPHREHKITQVLRECVASLTCQAALVAHVASTASTASAAASTYCETLSTVQMASRLHRMRRRRIKVSPSPPYSLSSLKRTNSFSLFSKLFSYLTQYNVGVGSAGGSGGSGGSSEESSRLGGGGESSASADPSSSEQSCDTVIYVGPVDDATDGEHPPVYLPR